MENQTLVQEKSPKWRQPVSLKANDLKDSIQKMIDEIQKFTNENKLEFITNSGVKTDSLQSLKQFDSEPFINLSKRSKKRIAKQIYKLSKKKTLVIINRFVSFFSKITGLEPIKVLPSREEQNIMTLRGNYKKAREEFFKSKNAFKEAKKEFKGKTYFG